MPENLQNIETIIVDTETPRIEYMKMPDGVTRKIGISLEEEQAIVESLSVLDENVTAINEDVEGLKESEEVIAISLNDLNSRITELVEENISLKNDIADLKQEIQAIKRTYMAYYDADASTGIGENNTYETS